MIHSINHMNTKRLVHIDSAVIIQLTIYMHKVEFGKDIISDKQRSVFASETQTATQ